MKMRTTSDRRLADGFLSSCHPTVHAVRRARKGMTMIEILVVIAIIAVLISLVGGGIMMALRKGPDVKNRQDIEALAVALEKFYTDNKQIYPPSKIRLCSHNIYNTNVALDALSLNYLNTLWPNIILPAPGQMGINWGNRPNWTNRSTSDDTLEGDQCLVFFLGGIPQVNANGLIGLEGFSNDPSNPAAAGGERKRWFEFDSGRLYQRTIPQGASISGWFPSYKDQYSIARGMTGIQPYVYFSSGKRPNGYDSSATTLGVTPYYQSGGPPGTAPTVYYMSSKYQLISAGLNGIFGPGGLWTSGTAGATPGGGKDDMTNFYENLMGVSK